MKTYIEDKISSNGKFKKRIEYTTDHEIYKIYNYKNNKLEGKVITYGEDKKIIKTELYENGKLEGKTKEIILGTEDIIVSVYKNNKLKKTYTEDIKLLILNNNIKKIKNKIIELISRGEISGFIFMSLFILLFIYIMNLLSIF